MFTLEKRWVKTDDLQFATMHSEQKFEFVEILVIENNHFQIHHGFVDLTDYDEQDIFSIIDSFGYSSVEEVQMISGAATNQIISECAFELETLEGANLVANLYDVSTLIQKMNQDYGIELSMNLFFV